MAGKGKKLTADDLLDVPLDTRVRDALSQIFAEQITTILDAKLSSFTGTIESIVAESKRLHLRCDKLSDDNKILVTEMKTLRVDISDLMEYTRRDDLWLFTALK